MSKDREAAVAAANTLLEEEGVEVEETPSEPTAEAVAEEPVQQETEEVPEDIKEIWEMPDFDEEAEQEIAAEAPEEEDDYEYSEESEELVGERKKRVAAEKKAAWLEAQRIRESAGKWKAEALKYTPYCEPFIEDIAKNATSRRGLLREAKRVNDVVEAWANEKFNKPDAEQLAAMRAELEAEVRADYEKNGWGKITAGPDSVPSDVADKREAFERLRANKAPLEKLVLARKELGDFDNI